MDFYAGLPKADLRARELFIYFSIYFPAILQDNSSLFLALQK
jgi:hypothetical protein